MTHSGAPAHARTSTFGIDRRSLLKAGAWSVPVIATAIATPLAAASGNIDPADCVVVPVGGFTVLGGTLSSDGRIGALPAANGQFGTGWTPAKPAVWNGTDFSQTDHAVAPDPASWWSGGGSTAEPGFLSLDDNDNRDAAPQTPTTVSLTFSVDAIAGVAYAFTLPVYTSRPDLGTQHLDVSISGAGVDMPGVVQGYVGDPAISQVPASVASYPALGLTQSVPVSFTARSNGIVSFTYTFTLAYVSGGARQNADFMVQAPQLVSCA